MKWLAYLLILGLSTATTVAGQAPPSDQPTVLFIGRPYFDDRGGHLTYGDEALFVRLSARGYHVTFVNESRFRSSLLQSTAFVFISASVRSDALVKNPEFAALKHTTVPVWVSEPWLFDDMDMTGSEALQDYGFLRGPSGEAPPLAQIADTTAHFTNNASEAIGWGIPTADATVHAQLEDGRALIFYYLPGALNARGDHMSGTRVGWFMRELVGDDVPLGTSIPQLASRAALHQFDLFVDLMPSLRIADEDELPAANPSAVAPLLPVSSGINNLSADGGGGNGQSVSDRDCIPNCKVAQRGCEEECGNKDILAPCTQECLSEYFACISGC